MIIDKTFLSREVEGLALWYLGNGQSYRANSCKHMLGR